MGPSMATYCGRVLLVLAAAMRCSTLEESPRGVTLGMAWDVGRGIDTGRLASALQKKVENYYGRRPWRNQLLSSGADSVGFRRLRLRRRLRGAFGSCAINAWRPDSSAD